MKRLKKDKIKKILAFMVALALMVSCMPSAYTISASETFGDGTEDFTDGESVSGSAAEEATPDVSSADQGEQVQTSNAAVFAVMWDAPEVQDAEDEISVEAEEPAADGDFTDGDGTSDPEVTPTETPAADPTVTEAPAVEPTVTEAPADDLTDPDDGNTDATITPEPAAQPVPV